MHTDNTLIDRTIGKVHLIVKTVYDPYPLWLKSIGGE